MTRLGSVWLALLLALLAAPATAGAKDFVVDSTAEGGDVALGDGVCAAGGGQCTLRAAVEQAGGFPGADRIVLPAGFYQLTSALTVSSTVDLDGAGARSVVIAGTTSAPVLTFSGAGVSTWSGFAAISGRGGVAVINTDLTLRRAAVKGNAISSTGPVVAGGGVRVDSGSLTLTDSLVQGNTAAVTDNSNVRGGGIAMASDTTLLAVNSTITDNQTSGSAADGNTGGGISLVGATATLRHVTLQGNRAVGGRGGNLHRSGATVSIADSIVADGTAQSGSNCYAAAGGSFTAGGRNLDTGATCGFGAGHFTNTASGLGAIGDHGGPTDTLVPALTSKAFDGALACEGTDQRGTPTPAGPACDIGAVEVGSDLRVAMVPSRTTADAGSDVTFVATVANAGPDPATQTSLAVTLPGGVTAGLVTPSQGSCTQTTCALGTMPAGTSATVTVVVAMPAADTLAAAAAAAAAQPDAVPADNTASSTVARTSAAPGGGTPGGTPAGPAPGGGPGTAARDTTAPMIGRLRAARIRTGRRGTVTGTLSEAASVKATVQRIVRKRRRAVGSFTARRGAGKLTLRLPAKLKRKTLRPGRYRLVVVATDAAGNRSAARTLTFRVLT